MKFVGSLVLAVTISLQVNAKPLKVPGSSIGENLPIRLLKAFVERSETYDSIAYPYGEAGDISFARTMSDLDEGIIDVLWTATSPDYERRMAAIYVPIYRGTLGMRLGIVKHSNKNTFANVTSIEQFREFVACQGKLWADTPVLEANGVLVAKSLKYPNLFAMVEGERCDYFPRAIFEPWAEVENNKQYNLIVDSYLMVRYINPMFFFAQSNNSTLKQEMERVFSSMIEDGTFQNLFLSDIDVRNALELANLKERTIIDFENPEITNAVHAIPREYWFDPLKSE